MYDRENNVSSPASPSENTTTNYGYEQVSREEKTRRVNGVFDAVANKYDLMNDLMSGGMHRLWKNRLISMLAPWPGRRYLDMAGGTGDIAFRIQDALVQKISARESQSQQQKTTTITIADINPSMLAEGKKRAIDQLRYYPTMEKCSSPEFASWDEQSEYWRQTEQTPEFDSNHDSENTQHAALEFLTCSAEAIPLPDNHMDGYTIAFGIRNVADIQTALNEAYRVLRSGGHFLCMEFSPHTHTLLQPIYDRYSHTLIPLLGRIITGDASPYRYLVDSIRTFPATPAFQHMMKQSGFRRLQTTPLSGGIVNIHSGWK